MYKNFNKKIEGYLFSPIELFVTVSIIILLVFIVIENLSVSRMKAYDALALKGYDKIKLALYSNMSLPNPVRKFMIQNMVGPAPLPEPLEDVFLDEGVRLNYLIRIAEKSKRGQSKDLLRFEVTHKKGDRIYRYTEVRGILTEQVISKSSLE
ncbi:MAG: hypothetical protein SGJ02_06685 [bacterium]|nr:hypothetical protein [bacterium]